MTIFGDSPAWVVALLCLLVAGILAVQNVGWLLWAKALLERRSRHLRAAPRNPTSEPEEQARRSAR